MYTTVHIKTADHPLRNAMYIYSKSRGILSQENRAVKFLHCRTSMKEQQFMQTNVQYMVDMR